MDISKNTKNLSEKIYLINNTANFSRENKMYSRKIIFQLNLKNISLMPNEGIFLDKNEINLHIQTLIDNKILVELDKPQIENIPKPQTQLTVFEKPKKITQPQIENPKLITNKILTDVLSVYQSLNVIENRLKQNLNVFYTRFGDNDILQIEGKTFYALGNNKTIFSNELQIYLIEALKIEHPSYLRALSLNYPSEPEMIAQNALKPFAYKNNLIGIINKTIKYTGQNFYNPILFHYLCIFKPNEFKNFINNYIKNTNILYIGCNPKKDMEKMFGEIKYYVQTPSVTAFSDFDNIWKNTQNILDNYDVNTIIPSCGQTSRVLSSLIFQKYILNTENPKNFNSFDIGSVMDAISGKITRGYLRNYYDVIRKNFLN